jgi:preprotein translocase subunit SecB
MSEETQATNGKTEDMGQMRQPIAVHAQYVKDLSVENPHAPLALREMKEAPSVEMSINVNVNEIEDKEAGRNFHEVVMSLRVVCSKEKQVLMIIEMEYGLACTIQDLPQDQIHPFLLIEVPHMMFPFVRQIVADVTGNAGFNPLYLTPVNFRNMYIQRFASQKPGAAEDNGEKVA